jgi:hypothetical protein
MKHEDSRSLQIRCFANFKRGPLSDDVVVLDISRVRSLPRSEQQCCAVFACQNPVAQLFRCAHMKAWPMRSAGLQNAGADISCLVIPAIIDNEIA